MNFRNFTALICWLGLLAVSAWAQETPGMTNLWQVKLPSGTSGSSPACAPDGTIYVGTFRGGLFAFTPEGQRKWKFQAGLEINSSPAVADDGTVYFGSRDQKLYALAPDGKMKWSFATEGWVDASPALATDGTIYFGSWDKNFYALNPDGSLKWKFATSNLVDSSAAIGADGIIYFGSHDGFFYALSTDGKLKWKFAAGAEISASPAIAADGTIYFSSTDGIFYARKPDGSERWRSRTQGWTSSSPVLDEAGNIYLSVNVEEFSLSPDGKVRWHFYINKPVTTSAAALTNGNIFIAGPWSASGLVNSAGKFLWNFPAGQGFYASANISPLGVIYIADDHLLSALRLATSATSAAKSSWPQWRADPQHTGRVQK